MQTSPEGKPAAQSAHLHPPPSVSAPRGTSPLPRADHAAVHIFPGSPNNPPTVSAPRRPIAGSSTIPPERLHAYQLGFISLFIKIAAAVVCGLLLVQQIPMIRETLPEAVPPSGTAAANPHGTPAAGWPLFSAATATAGAPLTLAYDPAGCLKPPDDYTRITIAGSTISQRTFSMLQQAARLYQGPFDITNKDITKGGYLTPGRTVGTPPGPGDLSLGTHDGGGVVDLAVPDPTGKGFKEIEPLIRSLRAAGFAAWFRDDTSGYAGNVHIHSVAIGDKDLSPEAKDQLTGIAGYFRGLNGLTGEYQMPDAHGGPVLCQWMIDAGYRDMRSAIAIAQETTPANGWMQTLRQTAESYITNNADQALLLAQQLGWTGNGNESVSNMCGPLSAVILDKSGLLPVQAWPPNYLKEAFWLASPSENGRPWMYFPKDQYTLQHVTTRIDRYDFENNPLCPGDFIYTYTNSRFGGDEHMLVVSEVDVKGRAWSVTNTMVINPVTHQRERNAQNQPLFNIEKVMLYDPGNPGVGVFRKDWVTDFVNYYTGLAGFDILRRNGACMESGSLLPYTIQPGDTLPRIAARLHTTVDAIVKQNGISDPAHLAPGQELHIPVNLTLASNSLAFSR
jgi:hypothetical protein